MNSYEVSSLIDKIFELTDIKKFTDSGSKVKVLISETEDFSDIRKQLKAYNVKSDIHPKALAFVVTVNYMLDDVAHIMVININKLLKKKVDGHYSNLYNLLDIELTDINKLILIILHEIGHLHHNLICERASIKSNKLMSNFKDFISKLAETKIIPHYIEEINLLNISECTAHRFSFLNIRFILNELGLLITKPNSLNNDSLFYSSVFTEENNISSLEEITKEIIIWSLIYSGDGSEDYDTFNNAVSVKLYEDSLSYDKQELLESIKVRKYLEDYEVKVEFLVSKDLLLLINKSDYLSKTYSTKLVQQEDTLFRLVLVILSAINNQNINIMLSKILDNLDEVSNLYSEAIQEQDSLISDGFDNYRNHFVRCVEGQVFMSINKVIRDLNINKPDLINKLNKLIM